MSADALASFEAKWAQARPELPLALRFAPASMRPFISAFACLASEIAHAAFQLAEPEVAATKLHWWAEELSGFAEGRARHPLTVVLAGHAPIRELGANVWASVVPAAFAQRDAAPVSALDKLLGAYARFEMPLASIEATLHPEFDVEMSAKAASLSRAFDEIIRLPELLARDRLPISLDLLARHQLSRNDLGQPGSLRDAALRDHFLALATHMSSLERRGLSPLTAIRLHADLQRSRRAARAGDPLAESVRNLDRLPFSSAWVGWRAARHMQARSLSDFAG